MKILLIAGHGAGDPGAIGTLNGKTYKEADLNREVVNTVAEKMGDYDAEVDIYDQSRNDSAVSTVDTLLDSRDEVSGVDMDEEGINMLNYQKWYSASSRMLTTLDDCLDKLINGTGRVGL